MLKEYVGNIKISTEKWAAYNSRSQNCSIAVTKENQRASRWDVGNLYTK